MLLPFIVVVLACAANAAIYESFDDVPAHQYDFIIVGGGTAGNVLANRLTENPEVSVLVLEAGGSDAGVVDTPPLLAPTLAPFTRFDWNYTTIPQKWLKGHSVAYPRGYVIGGSSSINYMAYTRGSADDWDRYARLTGDPGLSWRNVQKYIRKIENFVPPNDKHKITGEYDPAAHSTAGLVSVSLPGYQWPTNSLVVATTGDPAYSAEFPFNEDMNNGNTLGIGFEQATIGGGRRSSSATAYLAPHFLARPNLHVLLHARVTRIVPNGVDVKQPSFTHVEFTTGNSEAPRVVLLMLSGIGPSAELAKVGIKAIVDNVHVGKNMSDHVRLGNAWFSSENETAQTYTRDPDVLAAQEEMWRRSGQGPMSWGQADFLGFLRVPGNSSIFRNTRDPSAGPLSGHYEVIFENGLSVNNLTVPSTGSFFTITTCLLAPTSRGTVALNSSGPFDPPLIDPNWLATPFDIAVMVASVRAAQRFVTAPAFDGVVLEPFGAFADVYNGTDAQMEEYIRDGAGTIWHASGTAGMGPRGDDTWGVVDPEFKVKGTHGLRVVDASVLPIVPSGHTQVPVYILAERAAELIKESWSGKAAQN